MTISNVPTVENLREIARAAFKELRSTRLHVARDFENCRAAYDQLIAINRRDVFEGERYRHHRIMRRGSRAPEGTETPTTGDINHAP